jgi:hypothetical protein
MTEPEENLSVAIIIQSNHKDELLEDTVFKKDVWNTPLVTRSERLRISWNVDVMTNI